MEKYGIGNQITNKTNNVWMIYIFQLIEKILKFQFIDITFGANVDKEKLLSVWSEKTCCVCETFIECVEVLYFCRGKINGY